MMMAREKPNYRDDLEKQIKMINEVFPNQSLLNIKQVRKYLGWGYEKTKKIIPFTENCISVVKFASFLLNG